MEIDRKTSLNDHVKTMIVWHFSPDTGTPFWLDWASREGIDPREVISTVEDLDRFPRFEDDWLRFEPPDQWIPRAFANQSYNVFETGGTTGMPKQRLNWNDYQTDYAGLSETLHDEAFPRGGAWLMVGPTGPRRLRLAIEYLANLRGSPCYFVDLDPRWVKRCIANGDTRQAKAYMSHVVDQATTLLRHRNLTALFTTPRLLEAIGERVSLVQAGITGVFCGGTEMSPQTVRFVVEEVLEGKIYFLPIYGNTLMGLAHSLPVGPENNYSVTYYAPQPRAVTRVVNPDQPDQEVAYDAWGRVELTTLTKEFFMPRFLERDEAIRRRPCEAYPWDGVGEVRPFGTSKVEIVEGVY